MCWRWIDIDAEMLGRLRADADPPLDSPNDVLRRLLGLPPAGGEPEPSPRPLDEWPRTRAPVGSLLALGEYQQPILQVLSRGGAGARPRAPS